VTRRLHILQGFCVLWFRRTLCRRSNNYGNDMSWWSCMFRKKSPWRTPVPRPSQRSTAMKEKKLCASKTKTCGGHEAHPCHIKTCLFFSCCFPRK
jgi:hypothetical protein